MDGDTVDLSPLRRDTNWALTVKDANSWQHYTYYLSICGPLVNSSAVAGCLAKDPDSQGCQTLLPSDAPDARFPHTLGHNGQIQPLDSSSTSFLDGFRYTFSTPAGVDLCHKSLPRTVSILFTCGLQLGSPEFFGEQNCTYTFLWQTLAACTKAAGSPATTHAPPAGQTTAPPPQQLPCTAVDPQTNQAYDLTPLAGYAWTATDLRQDSNYTYYLSVCGSLPSPPPANCTPGYSACQTSIGGYVPRDLGLPASPIVRNGVLTLTYEHGRPCHTGAIRSTHISFTCGQNGLGHPVFNREDNCTYYFDWTTSAACPAAPSVGSACSATDPVTDDVYDLASLAGEWTVDNFTVAVCRATRECSGAGVCKHGSSYGVVSTQLSFLGGSIALYYRNGAPCAANPSVNQSSSILFVCDKKALSGDSTSVTLLNSPLSCSPTFEIRTSLVCPQDEIECIATDPADHTTYDLSALALASPQWVVLGDGYTFLLGLCGPAGDASPCPPGVAACQLKGSDPTFHKTLGYATSSPTVVSNGTILVTYTGGDNCHGNTERSTLLTLKCNPSAGVGAPSYVTEHSNCSYEFLWQTALACPVKPVVGGSCSFQDPLSGLTVDLSPLEGKDATIQLGSKQYYVSVCGHISNVLCRDQASCSIDSKGSKIAYGQPSSAVTVADQTISLTYTSGDSCAAGVLYSSRIIFTCDPNSPPSAAPRVSLLPSEDACVVVFRWYTSLVCTPALPSADCSLTHGGLVYDLSPLALSTSNYLAFTTATGTTDAFMYELNVCRQLVRTGSAAACPPGAAACQIPLGNTTHSAKSLGQPASPVWDPQAGLTLVYANGTGLCHGTHQRSTVIRFVCPDDGVEQEPTFIGESPSDCTYTFQWITSAACPVKQIVGADCMLSEPITNQRIDLTALKSLGPINVSHGGDLFTLQVCGSLTCNGTSSGGCQRASNGRLYNTGVANSALMFYDGVATLQYSGGDSCHQGSYHRSTTIHFECDLTAGLGRPEFVIELGNCDYVFRWRTALTCPIQVPCRVASSDGRFAYDLSALSRADRNWRASDMREGGKYAYELNVCRSLVTRSGWQCNPFSGACQIVNSTSSDFNLGFIGRPTVETTANGQPLLVLNYTGGDACHNGKYNRSARIEFTCPLDPTGAVMPGILGEPEFLYESATCVYVYSWRTSVACPLGSFPPVIGSACQVSGPQLDRSFSLSPLAGRVFNVSAAGYTYMLSVCGGLSGASVPGPCVGAGGCQLKANQAPVVTGQASSAVSIVNGAVVLNMTGGKPCHGGASIRSTLITFLCGPEPIGTPQFVTETASCQYVFVWYTAAACGTPRQTECVAVDPETGFTYDLSPLARTTTNWLIFRDSDDGDESAFELNICRSLVGSVDPACRGAAACLDRNDVSIPIGNVARPQVNSGVPYLEYDGGPCPHTPGTNYSTFIMFTCNEEGFVGTPDVLLDDEDACTFSFTWDTVYACNPLSPTATTLRPSTGPAPTTAPRTGTGSSPTTTPQPSTATVFVPLSRAECLALGPDGLVDLTGLSYNNYTADCPDDDDTPNSGCAKYTYILSVCGYLDCGGTTASACQIPNDAGSLQPLGLYVSRPSFVGTQLTLEYAHGSTCHKLYERRTRILFVCDMSAGTGTPVFDSETQDCVYVFMWRTARACIPTALPSLGCVLSGPNYAYDLHVLGRRPGQADWVVRSTRANETMTINVCRHLQSWPAPACEGAAACLTTASGPERTLNLGYAMTEPSLRADGSLVLQYALPSTYSLQQCQYGSTRSVVITFTCREGSIGEPVLVDSLSDCIYYINWPTFAACNLRTTNASAAGALHNCSLQDPVTGNHYDLNSLTGQTQIVNTSEYSFRLAVCGAAAGCPGGAGACQLASSNQVNSAGSVSKDLRLTSAGSLILQYRNGSLCHRGKADQVPRATVIQFVCDRSAAGTSPVYTGESDCTYFFTWTTKAACAQTRDVECLVSDPVSGRQYDLTPLKLTRGNWLIESTNASRYLFEMNVCRSLNPTAGSFASCSLASGVCQVEQSNTNVTYNLGQPAAPTLVNGKLQMVYNMGDLCKNPPGPRTTTVEFVCPPGGVNISFPLGRPKFVSEASTCNYLLRWETMAACPLAAPIVTSSCTVPVSDPVTGESYNIAAMNKIYKTTDPSGNTYLINPCDMLGRNCSDNSQARACQFTSEGVYSVGAVPTWTFADGVVSLAITGGKPCHSGAAARSALITFSCNSEQDLGPLFLQETGDCTYQFVWPSPLACPYRPVLECGARLPSGAFLDLSDLSVGNGATSVSGPDGTFYINVCSRAQHAGCLAEAGACLVRPDGTALSLGQYRGSGPAWTGSAVALGYFNGDRCPTGGRYSTTIKFVCGPPNLAVEQLPSDPCSYVFTWTSCQACPENTICAAATPPPPGTQSRSESSTSSTAGIAAGILVTAVVVGGVLVLFYRRPDLWQRLRDRVTELRQRRATAPGFKYSKVGVEGPAGESSTSLFGTGDDDVEDDELMPM